MPPFSIAQYTCTGPYSAAARRSRRALNALMALGAVLNKRAWWVKWTRRPELRAKWLREIEDGLIKINITQALDLWPQKWGGLPAFRSLRDIASAPSSATKRAAVERILAQVSYPTAQYRNDGFQDGYNYYSERYYESDGEDDVYEDTDDTEAKDHDEGAQKHRDHRSRDAQVSFDESAVDTDFDKVYRFHKKKNPFCQIRWYVTVVVLRDELRDLPLADWTARRMEDLVHSVDTTHREEIFTRTCAVIQAAVEDGANLAEIVQTFFPHEQRENVRKLIVLHLRKIRQFMAQSKQQISFMLELIIEQLELKTGKPIRDSEAVYVLGPAPKTWLSDNAIPARLKTKFVAEIAVLENVPDDQKDWHPNSNNQVLNLVHPSLYCGVIDKTQVVNSSIVGDVAEHMRKIMFAAPVDVLAMGPFMSGEDDWGYFQKSLTTTKFQWLPSEIDVSADGKSAAIRTYINNLHPETHAGLYKSIASIFVRFVPLFDQVLSSLDTNRDETKEKETVRAVLEAMLSEKPKSSLCRLIPPGLFEAGKPRFTLKGRRSQVIVKIAEIVLTPASPEYAGGSWHVEGTAAERIVATGLYYFGCENITESRLSFREFIRQPDPPGGLEQDDDSGVGMAYGVTRGSPLIHGLGSVTAMEDRCVVFPNIYQHKVEPFRLANPTKPGVRKILAFFLVEPTNGPIASTADVPPQQQQWIEDALKRVCKTLRFPAVVNDRIREFICPSGLSLQTAQRIRLELMDERSAHVIDERNPQWRFNLCEH